MSGNKINFDGKEIRKSDIHNNKKIFNIDDIDVKKILVSTKEQYRNYNSFKYFIGYNDNDIVKPLCSKQISQMTGYINNFNDDKNKNTITMSLKINDEKLLKKYNKIWRKKIERLMIIELQIIEFDSESIYGDDDKYIKTKTKTYKDSITTNFYNKKGSKKYQKEKYIANVYQ